MQIKRLERRKYEVTLDLTGYTWQIALSGGGLFPSEEKVLKAAQAIVSISHGCLRMSAMLTEALSHFDKMPESHRTVKSRENRDIWMTQARHFSELALAVPDQMMGFHTRSGGLTETAFRQIYQCVDAFEKHLVRAAPITGTPEKMDRFLAAWCANIISSVDATPPMWKLQWINEQFERSGNVPALRSKSPDTDARMRDKIHRTITAHTPNFLPVVAEQRPIRGDRAASLLNVMVPEIERKLEAVADPVERARLQERLGRLVSRVEVASANKDEKRALQDAILTIETLEESVESRLTAGDAGPTF